LKYNVKYLIEHIIVAACPENGTVVSYDASGVKHTYTSIQSAVNESGVGRKITVGPGTYNEVVTITSKTNLSLKGCNKPVVNGRFKLIQASNIIIDGFDIIASPGDNAITMLGGNNASENVTISNNSIHGADIEHSGISAARDNPELYILDNHIYENGRNGVVFVDATGGMHYLRRNVIENNGWNGVWVARDHNILLERNTISHNGTRPGTTGGRYGVIRERITGTGNPQGITLINNTITCNNGEEIAGKSSKDLGNYDQMIDATDTGNMTGCQP
jgi:parallel beta-helix repeat protein